MPRFAVALAALLWAAPSSALQPRHRPNRGASPSETHTPDDAGAAKRRPPVAPNKKSKRDERAEDLDRTVIRWHARGTGGIKRPNFISARELAFEARLEALTAHTAQNAAYSSKDIRSAVQRHVSESMLASLPVNPKPTPKQVASYAEAARGLMAQRIASELDDEDVAVRRAYGLKQLDLARRAEGISREELDALLRRRARASWYLDKMVAPMLRPSDLDLREAHRRGETPFTTQPFDDVKAPIERWYVSARLAAALDRYFRNVRSRVRVIVIHRPPRAVPVPRTRTPKKKTLPKKALPKTKAQKRRRAGRRRRI